MKVSGFFLFILFCCLETAHGQNSVEVSSLSGVKVFSPGNILLDGRSYGAEISYNLNQEGKRTDWVRRLNVKDISISGGYRYMGQVAIRDSLSSKGFLGNVFTLSGRLNFELLKFRRTEMLFYAGLGVAYSTSSYFKDENPLVGSRINFAPHAGIRFQTPITGSTAITAGADIFHYSNAGLRVPNRGINSFQLLLGVKQTLKHAQKDRKDSQPDSLSFIEFGADIGRRGSWKSDAGNWKTGFYLGYNYRLNTLFSLKAGADAVYYYTTFDGSSDRFQYYATSYDPCRWGVSAGAELWLGKLTISGNYGYYLKFNGFYPVKGYWTAGLKYWANSWAGVQTKVYVHQAQADFAAAGLMFRVNTR